MRTQIVRHFEFTFFYYMACYLSGQDESEYCTVIGYPSGQSGAILPARYGVPCPPKFNFWILLVFLAFDVVVYNLYLHVQLNIQASNFSTPIVDLTLFVSRFNFVVWRIQHSSLRNSTSKFTQFNIQLLKMHVFDIQPQASRWQSVWAQQTIKILP